MSAELKKFEGSHLVVLSYGVGQDSTAILLRLLHDKAFFDKYVGDAHFIVVTSDTGNEHPETYEYLEMMSRLLKRRGIEYYFLTPEKGYHSEAWPDLVSFYRRTSTVGSKAFPKSCSDNLKVKVIYRFLDQYIGERWGFEAGRKKAIKAFSERYGKVRVMIGIAGDETERAVGNTEGPLWMQRSVEKVYPLMEMGWDRSDCQEYIRSIGYEVPLPSNCMFCPFMSEAELFWLWKFYPERFREWVDVEKKNLEKNLDKGEKNLTVCGTRDPLEVVLKRAKQKYGNWSEQRLWQYKMTHGHCVMSKY